MTSSITHCSKRQGPSNLVTYRGIVGDCSVMINSIVSQLAITVYQLDSVSITYYLTKGIRKCLPLAVSSTFITCGLLGAGTSESRDGGEDNSPSPLQKMKIQEKNLYSSCD